MPHLSIEYVTFSLVIVMVYALLWTKRLPSAGGFQAFLDAVNSRGGNIFLLAAASIYFFGHSLKVFYYLFEASKDGKIQQDNAFALMALQFATSSAFGGAFGALLKTMTGENSKARSTDNGGSSDAPKTIDSTVTTTSTTHVDPMPPSTA